MNLNDKTILITGCTGDIGRNLVLTLDKMGAQLILIARNQIKLSELEDKLQNQHAHYICNLCSSTEVTKLIDSIRSSNIKIDHVINLAGNWHNKISHHFGIKIADYSESLLNEYLSLLHGLSLLSVEASKLMNTNGVMINFSGSFSPGEEGLIGEYMLKKGIENLTYQMSNEYKDQKLNFFAISPWYVWTETVEKFWPELKGKTLSKEQVIEKILEIIMTPDNFINGSVIELKI